MLKSMKSNLFNRVFVMFVLMLFLSSGVVAEDVPVAAISSGVENLDVNLYEGDFTFSIPLGSIPGRNGMGFGVSLNYISDVYKIVNKDNSEAQASEVGLGFNLGGGYYIHRDPGATINDMSDDYLYMNLPGLGSNRLVKVSEEITIPGGLWHREYKTEEDTYAKIEEWFDDQAMQYPVFEVTTIDGTSYSFNHARRTVAFNYDSDYEPYVVSDNPMNYIQARNWCNNYHGGLACPNTPSKDEDIRAAIGELRIGWLALYDEDGDGCWNGACALSDYENWAPGMPLSECPDSGDNPFKYVNTDGGENGQWVDTDNPDFGAAYAVCNALLGREGGSDRIEFTYQWDLTKIEDVNGNKVLFFYDDEGFEVDGSPYNKSYLDYIKDDMNNKIDIVWSDGREDVYYGDFIAGEAPANTVKDKYVTDVITTSGLGGVMSRWHFDYDYVNDDIFGEDNENKKLVLTSLAYWGEDGNSLQPYLFNYIDEEDSLLTGYVNEVLYPTGAKVNLEYEEKEIMGLVTYSGDEGWEEFVNSDIFDRGVIGSNYCDNMDYSPEDCINFGCYWKNNIDKCEMDEVAITGYRVKKKSVDDGLGTVEDVSYTYENALLHLEKKRQKYIGHDKVTIDYPAGFGSTVKEFCNNKGATCAAEIGCDEVSSAKLDRFMYSSETFNEGGSEVVASSNMNLCPIITYMPNTDPLDLIENPSFDDWTDGIPDGWTKIKSSAPSCSGYDLNEFILVDGNGWVKMRTNRDNSDCFYLSQTINGLEPFVGYALEGLARVKDEAGIIECANDNWRVKVYDPQTGDMLTLTSGCQEEIVEFYTSFEPSGSSVEIRLYPHGALYDGEDIMMWNAYRALEISRTDFGGGDLDGVTYDLRVFSRGSMVNGISNSVEYSTYNEKNGLPQYVVENGAKVSTTRFAFQQEYPEMEDEYMLSQVDLTTVNDFQGNYRFFETIWSDSSGKWRPYESYSGVDDERQFVSRINSYDQYGNILEVEDAKGHVTKTYYGDNGQCDNQGEAFKYSLPTCVEDNAGNEIKTFYTNKLMLRDVIDVNGGDTSYSYDGFNRLIGVSYPDGGSSSNEYGYALDECGYLSEEDSCLNYVSTRVDMGDGMISEGVSYSDGLARNIQTRVLKSEGEALVSDIEYNEISKVSEVTEPRSEQVGGFREVVYPLLGGLGDRMARDYLLKYNREGSGEGESVKNFYYDDPLGRVEKVFPLTLYQEGDEFEEDCVIAGCNKYSYDGNGITTITDLEGNQVSSTVDPFGNTVHVEDEISYIDYGYDSFGQLWSVSRNGRGETSSEYNSLGQLVWSWNIDSGERSFGYDENGNLKKTTIYANPDEVFENEDSQEILYEFENFYDNLDRVDYVTLDRNDGEPIQIILHNTYDDCQNGIGKLCRVDNNLGGYGGINSIEYNYDPSGRIVGVSESINDESTIFNSGYSYDLAGNLKGVGNSYNEEFSNINYEYNNLGQLIMVTTPGGDLVYNYNDLGMIDYVTYPNGAVSYYSYNDRNWISEIEIKDPDEETGQLYFHEKYPVYDEVGNLKKIEDHGPGENGAFSWFEYDDVYRLTSIDSGNYYLNGMVIDYTIDSFGNRLSRTVTGNDGSMPVWSEEYIYGGNRLDETTNDGCSYDHDDVGNMVLKACPDGETIYEYDVNNMITKINLPDGNVLVFGYDSSGRRVVKYSTVGDNKVTMYSYGSGISPLMEIECRWADLNFDGDVDIADFGIFASCYTQDDEGECITSDLDGNGHVGIADLGIFGGAYTMNFDSCVSVDMPRENPMEQVCEDACSSNLKEVVEFRDEICDCNGNSVKAGLNLDK